MEDSDVFPECDLDPICDPTVRIAAPAGACSSQCDNETKASAQADVLISECDKPQGIAAPAGAQKCLKPNNDQGLLFSPSPKVTPLLELDVVPPRKLPEPAVRSEASWTSLSTNSGSLIVTLRGRRRTVTEETRYRRTRRKRQRYRAYPFAAPSDEVPTMLQRDIPGPALAPDDWRRQLNKLDYDSLSQSTGTVRLCRFQ